jgi:hypothetical protein
MIKVLQLFLGICVVVALATPAPAQSGPECKEVVGEKSASDSESYGSNATTRSQSALKKGAKLDLDKKIGKLKTEASKLEKEVSGKVFTKSPVTFKCNPGHCDARQLVCGPQAVWAQSFVCIVCPPCCPSTM